MADDRRNRPDSKFTTNDWLTPPEIVEALGPFDLDPACHPAMPWRTATRMISLEKPYANANGETLCEHGDGLMAVSLEERDRCGSWWGPKSVRVWNNPPYDDILPWAWRHCKHGNSIMLVPAKSTDTDWGQVVLASCDAALFLAGRLLFHYPDGSKSTGKWSPSMLLAWGQNNVVALEGLQLPGTLLKPAKVTPYGKGMSDCKLANLCDAYDAAVAKGRLAGWEP